MAAASVPSRWRTRVPAMLIFVLACLPYWHTVSFDYAWDDKLAITANDYTTRGISALPDIFTRAVSVPFKHEYRPVPQAMHALEYQLSGGSPHLGHVLNVVWYALTCAMVYAFVRFVFPQLDRSFAFLVATLFAVHPLHVEVVANIKSRDEILALCFGLGALILLVQALEARSWGRLAAGAACFVIACLSKSNALTLLPLAALVAWYRTAEGRIDRALATGLAVATAGTLTAAVIFRHAQTTLAQDAALHLNSTVLNNIFLWSAHTETIIPTALVIIGRYLRLFVYPQPLIHLYGYDQLPLSHWADPLTWLVIAGLVGVAVAVVRAWPRRHPWVFGVVWFAVTYSVYSNLFFFAPDTMADRYMFMPSVGLAIIVVAAVFRLAALDPQAPTMRTSRAKSVIAVFGLALLALAVHTGMASEDWRNDWTLIHNRIRYMEHNAAAQAIYGQLLNKQGAQASTDAQRRADKAAAMHAFTAAVRIYPDFAAVWLAIGGLFAEQEVYDKAELAFLKAQRLEPLSPDAYLSLGALYFAEHDSELAIPYLEKAVLLDPKAEEAYVFLGKAYLQAGKLGNLGAMTTVAHRWFPQSVGVEALRAAYCFRKQDYGQAREIARWVVARDPRNLLALAILSSPELK